MHHKSLVAVLQLGAVYLDVPSIDPLVPQPIEQLHILPLGFQSGGGDAPLRILHPVTGGTEQVQLGLILFRGQPPTPAAGARNGHPLVFVNGQDHGSPIAAHVEAPSVGDLMLVRIAGGFNAQGMAAGRAAVQAGIRVVLLKLLVQAVEIFTLLQGAVPVALLVRLVKGFALPLHTGVTVHTQVIGTKLLLLLFQHTQHPLVCLLF